MPRTNPHSIKRKQNVQKKWQKDIAIMYRTCEQELPAKEWKLWWGLDRRLTENNSLSAAASSTRR